MRGKVNVGMFVIFNNVRVDLALLSFLSGGGDTFSEGGKEEDEDNTTFVTAFIIVLRIGSNGKSASVFWNKGSSSIINNGRYERYSNIIGLVGFLIGNEKL